uniref:Uncharacterized protein n=1 Tax=Brassica oleracea var. oleracea TaxID=109376 RepID=A0A0D3AS00_BRAOL
MKLYLGNIRCDVLLTEHDLLRKDILVFCGDLDINFVVTVFDPNTDFYGLSDIDSVVTDFDPNTDFISVRIRLKSQTGKTKADLSSHSLSPRVNLSLALNPSLLDLDISKA